MARINRVRVAVAVTAFGAAFACGGGGDGGGPVATDAGADAASGGAGSGSEAGSGGSGTQGVGGSADDGGSCEQLCSLNASSGCDSTVPAAECLPGCEEESTGPCADTLWTFMDCVADNPTTECNVVGIAVYPACELEQTAYFRCSGA